MTMKEPAESTHFTEMSLDMNTLMQQILEKDKSKSEA